MHSIDSCTYFDERLHVISLPRLANALVDTLASSILSALASALACALFLTLPMALGIALGGHVLGTIPCSPGIVSKFTTSLSLPLGMCSSQNLKS